MMMNENTDSYQHILHMVHDGAIMPDEAERLLDALDQPVSPPLAIQTVNVVDYPVKPKRKRKRDAPPDMRRFRRYWQYPFVVGVVLLSLAGMFASNTGSIWLQICGWSVFTLGALIALIGWWSQWSPWIHIRVHERKGARIAVSLPLPLGFLGRNLKLTRPLVRRFANADAAVYLDMATELLSSVESGLLADQPITIDVDEPDGDHIQVFIG